MNHTKKDIGDPTPEVAVCAEKRPGLAGFARQLGRDLLFCAAVAVVLTLMLAAFQTPSLEDWLYRFLINFIISTSIGLTLSGIYHFAHQPILARFPSRAAYYVSHALIVVVGVTIGVEIALRIIGTIGGPAPGILRLDVLRIGLVVATVIVITIVAFEKLKTHARTVELQAQQAQKEALRAQLETLQARTNPHFLFNSLNTVAGLIDENPAGAERVLEKLAGLFRYSLEGSKTEWVRLEQEIEAVRSYLEVESIRLGERLRAEVEVESGIGQTLVPPLILQPLVENAVLHAVAPRSAGGSITVEARRNGTALRLTVSDDGPGLGRSTHRGSGTALSDLGQRLAMIYDGRAGLEAEAAAGGGCQVRVTLPLEQSEHVEDAEDLEDVGPVEPGGKTA